MLIRLLCLLIGYGFGCIQTGYIVGRFKNIDVREHESGNAGASNVLRVIGRRAGFTVFVCDILKAVAAFVLCSLLFGGGGSFTEGYGVYPGLYAGLGAVLGHNFPFFLKFKGGKGIASTLGFMLVLDWRAALMVYAVGAVILLIKRYISLSSMVMAVLFAPLLLLFYHRIETVLITAGMAALAVFMHRGNIQRLANGTERRLSLAGKNKQI